MKDGQQKKNERKKKRFANASNRAVVAALLPSAGSWTRVNH